MGDLSKYSIEVSKTVEFIYDYHKKRGDSEKPRRYLGASEIGHECDRYLWFSFRKCFKNDFNGRMYRLFQTGHLEEFRFVEELEGIGCTVKPLDDNGEQFGVSAVGGHFKGHMDGVAIGIPEAPKTWHLLEFKTFKDDLFGKLVASGVEKSNPKHFAQMIVYMGLGGLERGLYLAKNKNTDELYSERVEHDPSKFKSIMARAERIIKSNQPPERLCSRRDDYRCKMCNAEAICWGAINDIAVDLPTKDCRTCCHATPEMDGDGRWSCSEGNDMEPCSEHLLIPGLIVFADVTDAGDTWIEFKNHKDGAIWRHGDGTNGTWSTEELTTTPKQMLGTKSVESVKTIFGGTITGVELSLIDRYPPEDSRLLWEGSDVVGILDPALQKIVTGDENGCLPSPTNSETTDKTVAVEYLGKILVVIYIGTGYAAIWGGVE